MEISHRLRQARYAAGEDLPALAQRIGVRQEHLRAIEDGRLEDLPPGIYGRNAVRLFASALGFDGAAVLAECEPSLSPLNEPIAALARLHGVRVRPPEVAPSTEDATHDHSAIDSPFPSWRQLAATAVDACVVAILLLFVVVAALTVLTAPISALKDAGGAFGLMGVLLGSGYFFCFGGVAGATVGERALWIDHARDQSTTVTLTQVAERALLSATEDVRSIQRCGEWLGRSTAAWMSSATGEAKG
jgi:transcriptional regulator with XRE-family HTH domain